MFVSASTKLRITVYLRPAVNTTVSWSSKKIWISPARARRTPPPLIKIYSNSIFVKRKYEYTSIQMIKLRIWHLDKLDKEFLDIEANKIVKRN